MKTKLKMTQEEPSREVTGSPGAPVNAAQEASAVMGAPENVGQAAGNPVAAPTQERRCDACNCLAQCGDVEAEAFGSDQQGNRASQEPPVAGVRAGPLKLDTTEQVFFYEQEFYVLSNFSAFDLMWKGYLYSTSEAAYHSEKFAEKDLRVRIMHAASAHDAFKLAEAHRDRRRKDWDAVKVGVMLDILRAKAKQHEYVRRKLLETGERELVENSWRDDYWGWGPNRDGQNVLGNLWMQVRSELRAAAPQQEPTP